jgi:hypothetical protein
MPKGILNQFIVAMHQWIADQKLVWRSGVVLEKDETRAEVMETFGQRSIRIRVEGENKKDLLIIVMYELDKIHNTYSRLKYQKLIPCNCDGCKGNQEPEFYSYKVLRKFYINRQGSIQCRHSFQMISILNLIEDVLDPKSLDEETERYQNYKEIVMGDKYVTSGQVGAVGPGAHSHDMQFQQIWNQVQGQIELPGLANELEKLKHKLKEESETEEQFEATKNIAAAETAAKAGNGPKVIEYLKKAGSWAFDTATKIGTSVAAEVIKKSMYL